jgi:hypothetical protein
MGESRNDFLSVGEWKNSTHKCKRNDKAKNCVMIQKNNSQQTENCFFELK